MGRLRKLPTLLLKVLLLLLLLLHELHLHQLLRRQPACSWLWCLARASPR